MSDEKTKLLNLMKFWLFGTFVIVWAAITAYIGMFTNRDWWAAIQAGFPIWGLTGLLTIVWFLFYRWWLARRDSAEMGGGMGNAGMGSSGMGGGMGSSEMGGGMGSSGTGESEGDS